MYDTWQEHVAAAAISSLTIAWTILVNREVPAPYLDEFFHVPQAQKYCKGDYTWDPKITTPPGLYLVAKLFSPIFGCSTKVLRIQNAFALSLIFFIVVEIRRCVRAQADPQRVKEDDPTSTGEENIDTGVVSQTPTLDALTAFNIALFPPLSLFGALYYTDVMSTAAVLLSYHAFLLTTKKSARTIFDDVIAVLTGVVALFFRQTNIFWVAVFPAGATVIQALKRNGLTSDSAANEGYVAILQESWSRGTIYDRPLQGRGFDFSDVILLVLTTAIAALRSPIIVLRSVTSYIFLLGLFAGFVLWNGSVVLGDKSAHTATLHTPQMLYIWPYIAFFSAPILLGPLSCCLTTFLPFQLKARIGLQQKPHASIYPQPLQAFLFITAGLLAVHFNTIIHPYTLADNRHYVFYVFRILLRHPSLKYIAVPVYYVCFWLSVQALAYPAVDLKELGEHTNSKPTTSASEAKNSPVQISFVLIWLLTTALSVVTAPLVEPRYFIVPWIIWRLHVPHAPIKLSIKGRTYAADARVVLETVWLLAINQAVQWLFLNRTFAWESEPGMVQRFLW